MIWPRSTTSDTCFDDGWEDASVDLEGFITDSFDVDITNSVETFYKFSVAVTDNVTITLTAYNEALDDYLPVAQASAPTGGGVLRLTAFIPRDTIHFFAITDGSVSDVDYETSFLTITRSKT
jgi:hypothetical protein